MPKLRINRALAAAGIASRRKAEELVRAGRVQINGKVVKQLALQVDPASDVVAVDGRTITLQPSTYFLYYKPRGVISSSCDEKDRTCVGDVCRQLPGTPRPVGRLDRNSEGLMLLTNDGQVAFRLTHPRFGVAKEYLVTVEPRLADRDARELVSGLSLSDGLGRLENIALLSETPSRSRLSVTLREGRNRLIRRLFEALGYDVKRLKRLSMGRLRLGNLKASEVRQLIQNEVDQLRRSLGLD